MTVYAGQYGPEPTLDDSGRLLKSTLAHVYVTGTTTPATLYTDRTKATTAPNPTTTDARGNLTFFANPGQCDIVVNNFRISVTIPDDPSEAQFTTGTVIGVNPGSMPTLQVKQADGTVATMNFLSTYSPNIGDTVQALGSVVVGPVAGALVVPVAVNATITAPTLGIGMTYAAEGITTSNVASNATITAPTLNITSAFFAPTPAIASQAAIVQQSAAVGTLSGTTMTVTLPAGIGANSRVVVTIVDSNDAVVVPAGWTSDATSLVRVGSYVLSSTSQTAGTKSFSFTTSTAAAGAWAYELSGTTGVAGQSTASHDASAATCGPTSSLTPSTAQSLSIGCFGVGSSTASALTRTAGQTYTVDHDIDAKGFASVHLVLAAAADITTTVSYTTGGAAHSNDFAIACYLGGAASAGSTTHLSVTVPNTATVGVPINATVSALDANGNVVAGYSGTINWTSTDAKATLPANGSTLTNGTGTFPVTFGQAGGFTVTATDSVTGSINGTSGTCTASAATGGKQARVAAGLIIPENSTTLSYVDPWLAWQNTYIPNAFGNVRPPLAWNCNYMTYVPAVNTAVGNIPPWLTSSGTNLTGGNGTTQKIGGIVIHIPLAYGGGPTVQQVAAGQADSVLASGGGYPGGPVGVFNKLLANGIKVSLRLGLECDPSWATWPWTTAGPTAYIAAFQEQSAFWRKNCPGILIEWNAYTFDSSKTTQALYDSKALPWYPGDQYLDVVSVDAYERSSGGGQQCPDVQLALSSCQAFAARHNKLFGVGELDWQQNDATCFNNTMALLDSFPAPNSTVAGGTYNGGLLYWAFFQAEPHDVAAPYGVQNYPAVLSAFQTRMASA